MSKLTIKQIEQKLSQTTNDKDPFVKKLTEDERKGVQQLLKRWKRKQANIEKLQKQFKQMSKLELALKESNYKYIAGLDEAGRGPLAGPVVAAAVILPDDFKLIGLNDSKTLSKSKREQFFEYITENAVAVGVGIVKASEIDKINIYEATKQAMLRSINNLSTKPDYLLVDALNLPSEIPQKSIVKGDAKSISIAAASIIAKVTRDRIMEQISEKYPAYKFEKNMGYGTKDHLKAIETYGVTKYHRKSFAPLR